MIVYQCLLFCSKFNAEAYRLYFQLTFRMRAKRCDRVLCDDSSLTALTARQIKELKKRNAQLEEENLILKKPLRYSRLAQTKMERLYNTTYQGGTTSKRFYDYIKDILIPNLKKR